MILKIFTIVAIVWSGSSCRLRDSDNQLDSEKSKKQVDAIRVLATTDFHGSFSPSEVEVDHDGSRFKFVYGGAAYLSSFMKVLREKSPYASIHLDGGDLFQGSFVSNNAEGIPVVDLYNHMGVDAVALGNHEFDFGPVGAETILSNPKANPTGALEAAISRANFPVLGINVLEKATKTQPKWIKSSVLIEKGGIVVGVIGATTPSTRTTTDATNIKHLDFGDGSKDPIAFVSDLVIGEAKRLKARGARLVFLTIHEGGSCFANLAEDAQNIENQCKGEVFEYGERLLGHVNGIIAGHTHRSINKVIREKGEELFIMQAQAKAAEILYADVSVSGKITNHDAVGVCSKNIMTKSIEVDGVRKTVQGCDSYFVNIKAGTPDKVVSIRQNKLFGKIPSPDQVVVDLLEPFNKSADKLLSRPAGITLAKDFSRSYKFENSLGNFMTSLLQKFSKVEVVYMNNGGMRAELPAKKITYNEVFNIFPFDGPVIKAKISGRQLRAILASDVESRDDGGFSWAGLRAEVENCKIKNVNLVREPGGAVVKPLEDSDEITVASLEFLFNKFDTLTGKPGDKPLSQTNTQEVMRDFTFKNIKNMNNDPGKFFDPAAPRINYLDDCGL